MCKAEAKIYDASNVLVKTLTKSGISCPVGGAAGSVVWNGRNTSGALVPAGTYTYKVQAIDNALNRSVIGAGAIGTTTVQR